MMSGPTRPFDPFGSTAAMPSSESSKAYNGTSTGTSAKVQDETGTQTPFADAAASSISTASSPTTTATATTAVSTGSTPFISPAAANTLPNGPSLRHNSIFELGGEPFGDQASGGSMTPSSRLSRIVGAANGAAPLSSANSPAALHPLGSIGSPHSFFSDAYTASQTPSGAAPNTSVGHGPSASSLTQLHAPSKRLSQSRFTSVLGDASSLSSGISRGGDKAVGAIPPGGGPNSSALDLKQGGFDSIQSQQASPNVVAQTGFSDFFVKSLPVSRRNSREFQNLWQELEGFSINDGPAQPVNISSGIPPHLSGYDGHSIAAHSSSGAFRSAADSLALGTSPKLPHGLLDDDMLSVRPNPASDASTPANPTKLANGAARGSNSKHPSDALQAATAFVSSGANSSNSSSNANSSFMAGRSSFSAYTRDARVTNASTSGLSTVAAALDSMAPQKNTTADLMLNDAARDMRLYDSSRGVNLIRNASTPVLNTKQYQVIQPVGELSALQPPARGIAPSNGFAAESGNMSIYDASGFVYNGGNNNNGSSNSSNGGQHHGAPQIGVGDLSYALAGSRVQPAAANYPYVMNPASGIGGRNQQQPFIPPGPASGSATPIAGGYGLSTPLVPGLPYGLGPQNPQLSVPHTPLQHAHHPASHIHMQQQQQQQQQQLQQMQQASQQPQVLSTQGQSQSQIQPQPQTQGQQQPPPLPQQQQQQQQQQQHGSHHHTKHQYSKPHRKGEAEANRFANVSLEDLKSTIFSVCKDQHGCRFLQKKLEDGHESHVNLIFEEVSPHFAVLMTDPFGNYLCQKLLEHCSEPQRTQIVTSVAPELVGISLNMHGTRAVQKMIEYLSNQEQVDAITKALGSSVVMLIRDLNGNHVIQKCLNRLSSKNNQFIYNAVANSCVEVATHRHGCCVFQRCIDFASSYQKGQLVKEVIDNALKLVQDPFGNYVVQYVLDLGNTDYTEPLIRMFVSHICGLSVQKFSSNVMEKCIRLASPATRKQLVAPLLHREKLDTLMRDSYGNYVVQTALDFADPQQRAEIIDAIVPLLASIRHTPYGKRIYIKLQRDGFVSAVPSAAGSRHASPTLGPSIGSHSAAALTNMAHYPVSIGPAMLAPNGVSMAAAAAGSALSRGVSPTAGNSTSSSSLPPPSLGQGRAYVPANASGGGATALDQAGLSSFHQALSFQQQQQQQQQQQGMHPGGMYMYKMASHDPAALHSQMYQAPGAAAHHLLTPAHPGSSNGIHERPAIASSGPSSSVPASSAPSAATSDASRLQASSHYGAL